MPVMSNVDPINGLAVAAPPEGPEAQQAQRARARASVPTLLLLTFIMFVMTNRNAQESIEREDRLHGLEQMSAQLANYSAWLHYGNATDNFTLPVHHPAVVPLVNSFLHWEGVPWPTLSSYRSNMTGYFHGLVTHLNITNATIDDNGAPSAPWATYALGLTNALNATLAKQKRGTWNWANTDKVSFVIVDRKVVPDNVTEEAAIAHGRFQLTDTKLDDQLAFFFEAVHFPSNGSIYGLAEPNRIRPDLRDLPSLVSEYLRNTTGRIVEAEMSSRIAKAQQILTSNSYDTAEETTADDTPEQSCSFMLYGQVTPATGVSQRVMQEVETENQNPTGLGPVLPKPRMGFNGVLLSPECGLLYTISGMDGVSAPQWYRKVTSYAGFVTLLCLAQVILLGRHTARSRTPLALSRISRWTFLTQAIIDAVSFAGHTTFSVLTEGRASISLFAPGFLYGVLFMSEMRLAMDIYQHQAPEDVVITPPTPAPALPGPPGSGASTPINEDLEPLLTAEQGEARPIYPPAPAPPPVATTPSTTVPPRPSFLYHICSDPQARTYMFMCLMIASLVQLAMAPTLGLVVAGIAYCSIWSFPIIRSARRGRASGLSIEYTVGITICRLLFASYLLICPNNVLEVKPRIWIWPVAGLMFLQAVLLIFQDTLGPAFFLPTRWVQRMPTYDYHPPLHDNEDKEGGSSATLGDCAICLDVIVPEHDDAEDDATSSGVGIAAASGLIGRVNKAKARKEYALAPCHHLFHTACLEKWLAIKNVCPQCRRLLPALA